MKIVTFLTTLLAPFCVSQAINGEKAKILQATPSGPYGARSRGLTRYCNAVSQFLSNNRKTLFEHSKSPSSIPQGSYDAGDRCRACPRGTVSSSPGSTQCLSCPPGSHVSQSRTQCLTCPPHLFFRRLTGDCHACAAGFVVNKAQRGCRPIPTPCAPGFFGKGGPNCRPCLNFRFSSQSGSLKCSRCPVGTTVNPSRTGCDRCPSDTVSISTRSLCKICPAGTRPNKVQGKCIPIPTPCAPGFFGKGGPNCRPCPGNRISNVSGALRCVPCPRGSRRNTSRTQCLTCPPRHTFDIPNELCHPCPHGYRPNPRREFCIPK